MKYLLVGLALVGGCAQLQHEAQVRVSGAPLVNVCYWAIAGGEYYRNAAQAELARRGADCAAEMPMVQAMIHARAAESQAEAERLRGQREAMRSRSRAVTQVAPPSTPAPPPATHCQTRTIFGAIHTVCQ